MLHQLIEKCNLRIHNISMIIIGEFLNFCLSHGLSLFRCEVNITSFLLVFIKNQLLQYIKEEEAKCFFYHRFFIILFRVPATGLEPTTT